MDDNAPLVGDPRASLAIRPDVAGDSAMPPTPSRPTTPSTSGSNPPRPTNVSPTASSVLTSPAPRLSIASRPPSVTRSTDGDVIYDFGGRGTSLSRQFQSSGLEGGRGSVLPKVEEEDEQVNEVLRARPPPGVDEDVDMDDGELESDEELSSVQSRPATPSESPPRMEE